jgi:hypothetical protein
MKVKFQKKTYRQGDLVNNILKMYNDQSVLHSGYNWYTEAHKLAETWAKEHKVSTMVMAGVIASLSPNTSWDENKKLVEDFMHTGTCGHTGVMIGKAVGCMFATSDKEILSILNGEKIKSFFLNILYPEVRTTVTIDRHAVAVALGRVPSGKHITVKQYAFFVGAYQRAADVLDLMPHQLQAVTWVKWRLFKKEMV